MLLALCQPACVGLGVSIDVKEEMPVAVSKKNLDRRLERRGKAAWKIPLGTALIEDMRWLGDDFMYVSLRTNSDGLDNLDHFVLDAATGETLWRKERPNSDNRYSFLYNSSASLLFLVDDKKGNRQLLALDSQSGSKRWSFGLRSAKKSSPLAPTIIPDAGMIIAVDGRKGVATGILIDTGEHLWQRKFARSTDGYLPLVTDSQGLWDPNGSLQAVSISDGKTLWQTKVRVGVTDNVPAQFADGQLFAVDSDHAVVILDAKSGSVLWRTELPGGLLPANVYPYEDRVYVRAKSPRAREGDWSHSLIALNRKDGVLMWTHGSADPSLSNLIHSGDSVYHATSSKVFSLNRVTGKEQFSSEVSNTGRTFPVRLRWMQNHIVYIGELVIAGIESTTGQILFSHGMTPISPETSLNALDVSIPRLREEMAAGRAGSTGPSFSLGESQRYQNLANSYHRQAQSYRSQQIVARSSGKRRKAERAKDQADSAQIFGNMASAHARTMATIEMSIAVMNLAIKMHEMFELAGIKARLDRQILFRNSILSNYATAENADYVFRPHARYRSSDNQFVGIDVINLETGGSRFNYLSPSYRSYGQWNLIDFERGNVIHHGVGLDSSDHHLSEPHKANLLAPKIRTVETFLIASPVRLP